MATPVVSKPVQGHAVKQEFPDRRAIVQAQQVKQARLAQIEAQRAAEEAANAQAAQVAATPVQTPTAAPAPVQAATGGSHTDWMAAAGIAESDYGYVDYIVNRESGWRVNASNGSTWGLCQSLPGNKMASAGADWETNPITQLRWCASYSSRYGGWAGSYQAWLSQHWW